MMNLIVEMDVSTPEQFIRVIRLPKNVLKNRQLSM